MNFRSSNKWKKKNGKDQELVTKIAKALENVRFFLQGGIGDIDLVSVREDVTVYVRLFGPVKPVLPVFLT